MEEWPQEIVQTYSNQLVQLYSSIYNTVCCRIVRSLEVILDAFVKQENFTDIEITENDIAFKGQRVRHDHSAKCYIIV